MSPSWIFRCYLDNGADIIDAWFNAQANVDWRDIAQAKFDTRVRYLKQQPQSNWNKNDYVKPLHGSGQGIFEIRFEVKNIACRPLGFYSGLMEFTILIMATKKGNKWNPANAIELAVSRRVEIGQDRRKSHEHEFQ